MGREYGVFIILVVGLVSGVLGGIWRRCYGGWDSSIWEKVFGRLGSAFHRWFWRIVSLAFLYCASYFWRGIAWYWSVYVALAGHFIVWDWTFGMYMGIGRHPAPDERTRSEYDEQVFGRVLNWLFPITKSSLFSVSGRYEDFYDFLGMAFRYTAPWLLLFWVPTFNSGLLAIGFAIGLAYLVCVRLCEENPTRTGSLFIGGFAEFASGALVWASMALNGIV